jgi:hypothetical protein
MLKPQKRQVRGLSLEQERGVAQYLFENRDAWLKSNVTQDRLNDAVRSGKLPLKSGVEIWVGFLDRNRKVRSNDSNLLKLTGLAGQSGFSVDGIPREGAPLVVVVETPETREQLSDPDRGFVRTKIVPRFKYDEEISIEKRGLIRRSKTKTSSLDISETSAWSFLSRLIAGEEPLPQDRDLVREIAELSCYKVHLRNASIAAEEQIEQQIAAKRLRLIGVEIAELHYSGRADPKDMAKSVAISGVAGSSGALTIDRYTPQNLHFPSWIYFSVSVLNAILLGGIDFLDNFIGQLQIAKSAMNANGAASSGTLLKALTGEDRFLIVLKNAVSIFPSRAEGVTLLQHLKRVGGEMIARRSLLPLFVRPQIFAGPDAKYARKAASDAFNGAAWGTLFAVAFSGVLKAPQIDRLLKIAMDGLLGIGGALSIPSGFRKSYRQAYYTNLHLIDSGKVPEPQTDKHQWAKMMARNEVLARATNRAAAKAISVVPLINSAAVAMGEYVFSPGVGDSVIDATEPPAENVATTIFLAAGAGRAKEAARSVVLNSGINIPTTHKEVQRAYVGRWANAAGRVMAIGVRLDDGCGRTAKGRGV